MGKSNPILNPIYKDKFPKKYPMALLGARGIPNFIENKNDIDLYDLKLNNFNINSDWKLNRKYKSIVCTRCLYFCKNPLVFLKKCKEYLEEDGEIFIDSGLGHHITRFKNFKVGWVKDGEHEWEYEEGNFLWSTIWDESFLKNNQVKLFQKRIKKFGYKDLNKAIYNEVPSIIKVDEIKAMFKEINITFLTLWENMPQLYIFLNIKII